MAESHVVSGLVAKRAELAGLMDHHRKEIGRIGGDLEHIDATIKLFAPEVDLRGVRSKTYRERANHFRPGEGPRAVLDALRTAGRPLTSRELSERIMTARGIERTPQMVENVQKCLLTVLKTIGKKGLVRIVSVDERTGARSWEIA